jgi:hypothetical protein
LLTGATALLINNIYLLIAHTKPPLITAVTGIAISVKVRQNFELCAYLADNRDCIL